MKLIIKMLLMLGFLLLLAERYKNLDVVGQQTMQLSKDVKKLNESMEQAALLDNSIIAGTAIEEPEPMSPIQLQQIARQQAWEEKNAENYVKVGGGIVAKEQLPATHATNLDCKGWQSSYLIEPTPEKEKYLKQYCELH